MRTFSKLVFKLLLSIASVAAIRYYSYRYSYYRYSYSYYRYSYYRYSYSYYDYYYYTYYYSSDAGIIAGGVVGGIIGFSVLVSLIVWCCNYCGNSGRPTGRVIMQPNIATVATIATPPVAFATTEIAGSEYSHPPPPYPGVEPPELHDVVNGPQHPAGTNQLTENQGISNPLAELNTINNDDQTKTF